jgi:hypothetical protein
MKQRSLLAFVSLVPLACASGQSSSEPPTAPAAAEPESGDAGEEKPVGTKLLRDVTDSKDSYEIGANDGQGLGNYSLKLNGKSLWPPQGEGCPALIACCQELAALADPLALSCLLATGRDRDCNVAKNTAVAVANEQAFAVPSSCK